PCPIQRVERAWAASIPDREGFSAISATRERLTRFGLSRRAASEVGAALRFAADDSSRMIPLGTNTRLEFCAEDKHAADNFAPHPLRHPLGSRLSRHGDRLRTVAGRRPADADSAREPPGP